MDTETEPGVQVTGRRSGEALFVLVGGIVLLSFWLIFMAAMDAAVLGLRP